MTNTENKTNTTYAGALRLEREGSLKAAADVYRQLLRRAPRSTKILHRLMIVYRRLKDVDSEVKIIDSAIKIQEQYYGAGKNAGKQITAISKQLNLSLGHTDKKGRAINKPPEVVKLEQRKERLLKKKR